MAMDMALLTEMEMSGTRLRTESPIIQAARTRWPLQTPRIQSFRAWGLSAAKCGTYDNIALLAIVVSFSFLIYISFFIPDLNTETFYS